MLFCYSQDNCKSIPNTGQEDTDKNGVGDICEYDTDGDRYLNDAVIQSFVQAVISLLVQGLILKDAPMSAHKTVL